LARFKRFIKRGSDLSWLKAEIIGGVVEAPHGLGRGFRRVGVHRVSKAPGKSFEGKASLQAYELPRIVLPAQGFSQLIGREFKVFKAKLHIDGEGEGEAVILFFP